jgi:large subunit ribosomal protein L1
MPQDSKYPIEEAVKAVKKHSKAKFDATVELHINLQLDVKKQDQQVRFTTTLPHGTGKELKVAVMASKKVSNADLELTESDLQKIEEGKLKPGSDFDVIVAEPRMMGKLAQVARILGPAGVMPNPKAGTVTEDVEKTVEQIKKGKIEIRTEQVHPIIHTVIGKVSFADNKLVENYQEIMSSLRQNRPTKAKPNFIKSAFLTSSMGRSYQLELDTE